MRHALHSYSVLCSMDLRGKNSQGLYETYAAIDVPGMVTPDKAGRGTHIGAIQPPDYPVGMFPSPSDSDKQGSSAMDTSSNSINMSRTHSNNSNASSSGSTARKQQRST